MKYIRQAFAAMQILFVVAAALTIAAMFFKIVVAPIAPLVTILLAAFFTFLTFYNWPTAVLSLAGIVLYVASWPAVNMWGTWPGMLIWSIGVLVWFVAVFKSLANSYSVTDMVAV